MLNAIARFFGWDNRPPVRSPVQAKVRSPETARGMVYPGPPSAVVLPGFPAAAHDKSKAEASVGEVKPAMVDIPGNVDQRTPQVASPGLPPVDPVTQPPAVVAGDVMQPISRPRKSRAKNIKKENPGRSVRGGVQVSRDNPS